VNIAWNVTRSLFKVLFECIEHMSLSSYRKQTVQGHLYGDKPLLDLLRTMENVYLFVDTVQEVPDKLVALEHVITGILKQTVECAIFIREYTGHGFAGW
jgi:hypothetical protein